MSLSTSMLEIGVPVWQIKLDIWFLAVFTLTTEWKIFGLLSPRCIQDFLLFCLNISSSMPNQKERSAGNLLSLSCMIIRRGWDCKLEWTLDNSFLIWSTFSEGEETPCLHQSRRDYLTYFSFMVTLYIGTPCTLIAQALARRASKPAHFNQ